MGLKYNTNYAGLSLTGAYARVVYFTGNKDTIYFSVTTFATEGGTPLVTADYQCAYSLTSTSNVLTQAYTYLKTLPDFAGATDVLESV